MTAAVQRFVVLAVPRTGSNLLCTLLDSHPEILCHHEVFNPQGIFLSLSQRHLGEPIALEQRDQRPLEFMEMIWDTGKGYHCVGFKWTLGQSDTVLQAVCRDERVKKIVLRRRGRIKTFVSETIAQATDQWEVYDRQELVQPRPRIRVDCEKLHDHIARNHRFYDQLVDTLEECAQPYIELFYEEVLEPAEHERILRFLGVTDSQLPLNAASVKQNSTNLQETIANFSELEASLQGTDLLSELYEQES